METMNNSVEVIRKYWYSSPFWREVFTIVGLFLPVPVEYANHAMFTIGNHDFATTIGVGKYNIPLGLIIIFVIKILC